MIGELEAAVAADPYREGLWELLITALYRAGRQADALAAYRRARARLSDDLGLEPGPRLRQLEQQVLEHDPALRPPAGNLPSLAAELVGRDAEIAAVARLLEAGRLVEVVGPGGIGKTALAIATGRTLPGAVWLIRLESATTPGEVLDTVIAALDVAGGEAALLERLRSTARGPHPRQLRARPRRRRGARGPPPRRRPGLRILCTSQVPLGVDGEAVLELAPLPLADAVELFARRATARRDEPPEAARELCRSLDGLPLAIELAAARTRTLSIAEISRRLDDRFSVLSDPASRKPERRRALRATIGWSYDLLFPDDKRGLWALATFAGGAPLPAVEAVLAALDVPASAAIDVIGRLAARSLVIVEQGERYRLLDSIRAFALESMAEAGATGDALAAHAAWYGAAAGASTAGVRSSRQAEYLAFARRERPNLDAALAWSAANDPPLALRIADGFGWAWIVLGDSRGAERLLAGLAAAGEAAPASERASAYLLAAWIEASTGHLELAREHVGIAAGLAEDADLRARCDYYLAYVVSHHGEWEHALELTARSAAGLEHAWDQAANALFAARAAISAGDRERAAAARDEVERWLREVDDPWLHVRRDAMLGELARVEHRFDDAVAPHRPRRPDLGPARLPADRGVPALEPGPCAVPGRRLRDRRGHARARDREGGGDRRRAARHARPRPSRARAAGARPDRAGARGARDGRAPGTARPAAASRRRWASACWPRSTRATATRAPRAARGAARRRPPRRRRAGGGLRARRARPLRRGRPADAGRRALHHRARPGRRWFSTTNASRPHMTIAIPIACR